MKCRLSSLALCLVLASCTNQPRVLRDTFFALGTLVEVSVFEPPERTEDVLHELESVLLDEERRWRAWGEGELAEVNRSLADDKSVALSPALTAGIHRARTISAASGGLFNPAMGKLVQAWGFHEEERPEEAPPGIQVLQALLPAPSLDALEEDKGVWHSTDRRLWLDMGAFAKGLAIEKGIGVLRKHGIENAIVNAGGDLKVIGRHGDRAWKIGVRNPRGDGVIAAVNAEGNESVFTSGDYERFFEWKGERFHHILDPRTGRPARGVTSVTVMHADAALADAGATALFVAGEDDWKKVADSLGIERAMMVFADGHIEMTNAMRARVTLEDGSTNVEIAH